MNQINTKDNFKYYWNSKLNAIIILTGLLLMLLSFINEDKSSFKNKVSDVFQNIYDKNREIW